ncbi:inositol monophosphatase [Moniliophthora roreri MCA 2997]|uniref:Inositol-1-monophosphatase n=1 Tax=Moniliophthora roreri (strain MCA 2997) TaxID=1381753 RepID=V2XKP7_MONRO|nr:inositol monophosphatase [Moniliophthora roreri MCA 2997]
MSTPELNASDLQSILDFTVTLARTAGELILEGGAAIRSAGSSVDLKKNSTDLVTEYDVKVEELVKKEIAAKYPGFKFIGEESYAAGSRSALTDEPTYCVDPIDGTTNFVHGFPWVCISLGLIYKRRPVLGVIYNPFLNLLYTGVKGQGSYLSQNGATPVKLPLAKAPKPLESLGQAMIAVEWGNDRSLAPMTKRSDSFHRLAGDPSSGVAGGRMVHSIRSLGSSALNFAMVAQGGLDLYWEIGCWPWDVCAGSLIAQEAGCTLSGSHAVFAATKSTPEFGEITEEILVGRKYIVVRAIGDSETEKGADAQKRIMEDFYNAAEDYNVST